MEVTIVEVRCTEEATELVTAALWDLGCSGVAETSDDGTVTLLAGFSSAELSTIETVLRRWVGAGVLAVAAKEPETETWRQYAAPVVAGGFRIRLPEHPPIESPLTDLVIEPGRVFGSGSHPSTRLALEALASLDLDGVTIADIGCGTGVLAIAAASRGAIVTAVDIDPDAVRLTGRNIAENGVPVDVRVGSADALGSDRFDIVVANLTIDIQRDLAPLVTDRAAALVLSGLLTTQVDDAVGLYPTHRLTRRLEEGEWGCVVLERPELSPSRG